MNHEAEHKEYEQHQEFIASIPLLAEFTQYAQDGEAWVHTKVFPKITEDGTVITKVFAEEASGMFSNYDTRMGHTQLMAPKVKGTEYSWVVEQVGYANV